LKQPKACAVSGFASDKKLSAPTDIIGTSVKAQTEVLKGKLRK